MTTTTEPTYTKEIKYDFEMHDYALLLDGELVGYARTYHEGETTLDKLVYDLLNPQPPQPPTPAAQMAVLADEYLEAKSKNRLDDAKRIKQQAEEIEAAHPGTQLLVIASRKAAA